MSLQTKFALLLGVIGLTVILALSASLWALNHMQNEVRKPFETMSSTLIELQAIRLAVERQRELLSAPPADGPVADEFAKEAGRISAAMQKIVANEAAVTIAGKTTLANLRTRLAESRELSEQHLLQTPPTDAAAAQDALGHSFALIRRIESRIVEDTNGLVMRATDVRRELVWLSAVVCFLIVLACLLGVLLVRRWVVQPVADLRAAAARIAGGDFAHRIPVRGSDELGALSTEVNSMAAMVKTMQDEAVQRERLAAVGEVVRRIAHNLRSPLAGIRGLAELTRKELDAPGVPKDLQDDVGENQQRIIGAVDRFESWLRDLLDATRPLEVVYRTMDPAGWLTSVVDAYRPKAQANRVSLEVRTDDAPDRVAFDPRHLEHALGAMISNALDAVSAAQGHGGIVRVVCGRVPLAGHNGQGGEEWELRVEDNGPGVPADLRERIFTPYFTTKREGTGIGLALAQQVVRAHRGSLSLLKFSHEGGTVEAAASETRGAVFSARMPIGPIELDPSGVATAGHPEFSSGQNSRHRG